jgi:hypothetical protein
MQMKGEYVKMKMDKERKAKEKKKQGETKSAIHSQNQDCVRRSWCLLKTSVKTGQTTYQTYVIVTDSLSLSLW